VSLNDEKLEHYADGCRTIEGAERYSTKYDRELHKRISSFFERRAIRRAIAVTGVEPGSVLDVPCGAGRLSPVLRPASSLLVSGDYSMSMVKTFRRTHDGPCFVGSAFELPFRDRAFDIVFSARLSHHISSADRRADYLSAIMRVSRRWVIVTVFDRASLKNRVREVQRRFNHKRSKHTLSRSDVKEIAEASGFEVATGFPLSRVMSGHVFYVLERKGATSELALAHRAAA